MRTGGQTLVNPGLGVDKDRESTLLFRTHPERPMYVVHIRTQDTNVYG